MGDHSRRESNPDLRICSRSLNNEDLYPLITNHSKDRNALITVGLLCVLLLIQRQSMPSPNEDLSSTEGETRYPQFCDTVDQFWAIVSNHDG